MNDQIFEKPDRFVNKVFLHHSASDHEEHDDIEVIRDWHVNHNGWSDVGYHFFIKKDGTIQLGRSLEVQPASQKGHNKDSISICLSGLHVYTAQQMKSLKELCKQINLLYYGQVTFHGHKEVRPTKCPYYDYKRILELDSNGKMKLGDLYE